MESKERERSDRKLLKRWEEDNDINLSSPPRNVQMYTHTPSHRQVKFISDLGCRSFWCIVYQDIFPVCQNNIFFLCLLKSHFPPDKLLNVFIKVKSTLGCFEESE